MDGCGRSSDYQRSVAPGLIRQRPGHSPSRHIRPAWATTEALDHSRCGQTFVALGI